MPAPPQLTDLIARFREHLPDYHAGAYNETQLRRDFLDPFFKLLGWDVHNKAGYAEAYREVVHEDKVKVGGMTKAPDYSFRVGGQRKFFLEAKKPSIHIKEDVAPAYQLRRYAWSAGLSLTILSDFEEFAVYDCRIKPAVSDKASKSRLLYFTFEEYESRWDELVGLFSKEAILKGAFDRYAATAKGKKGTASVDAEFLKEIEAWRDLLARHIALRNPGLSGLDLNYAVQQTIDRIIFLRICEDRGIEPYGRLQALLNGGNTYDRLKQLFRDADDRYNSGLFHFASSHPSPSGGGAGGEGKRRGHPDELTLLLKLDDKPLKEILKDLYYPNSPYEFSVLPADMLGQVYEQFLGKVIRLTPGGQARVEDKPEVKKAGGVYYTPTYIVDYIVRQTVGRLLEGKTPRQIEKIRVLDPACGSGSFLIGAYQFLLDWYLNAYASQDPEKHARGRAPKIRQGANGWRLTTAERKRILLAHIHGVDIDTRAVEVTKLSLLLKMLEGESGDSLNSQFSLFRERVLPDLDANIQCGNSLIGTDFYDGRLDLDEDERRRVNAFDWEAGFPEVFRAGGFDAVIGNPPYVRQESLADFKAYFADHYESYAGTADLYVYFMEQGIRLLNPGGIYGIIVSSSFMRATYGEPLRRTLKQDAAVLELIDFGGQAVFTNAKDTYVCIPILSRDKQPKRVNTCLVHSLEFNNLSEYVAEHGYSIPAEQLSDEAWTVRSEAELATFDKIMEAGIPLGKYVGDGFFRGVTTGLNEAFVIDSATRAQLISQDKRSAELIKPVLGGEDIRRYFYRSTDAWLIFPRRGVDIDRYPAIKAHLSQWKADLTPKKTKDDKRGRKPGRYQWHEIQDDVAYWQIFDQPKLIFPDIAKNPRFVLDTESHYLTNTAYCLGTDDRYLLGILNSRLFWFAISHISIPFGVRAGEFRYRLIYQYMEKVPIRAIDSSNPADRDRHDKMVKLVESMLKLHEQLADAKTAHDKTLIQRQIDATDRQIDALVYELYGLTEDEIHIVEAGAA